MSEMIERVARAMCEEVERRTDASEPQPVWKTLGFASREAYVDDAWPAYVSQARAGIEAMREAPENPDAPGELPWSMRVCASHDHCGAYLAREDWGSLIDIVLSGDDRASTTIDGAPQLS